MAGRKAPESDDLNLAAVFDGIDKIDLGGTDMVDAKDILSPGRAKKYRVGRRGLLKNMSQDKLATELLREQVSEQRQRRRFRVLMFWSFLILLLAQHVGLAVLIGFAIAGGFIEEVQPLLSVITSATLVETFAIIRIMVKFIFSPGDFRGSEDRAGKK